MSKQPSDNAYKLLELIIPVGFEPMPEAYKEGEVIFQLARNQYQSHKCLEAAETFISSAAYMTIDPDHEYAETFQRNRLSAYKNGIYAWAMVASDEPVKEAVYEAARLIERQDPACANEIWALVKRFIG